MDFTSFSKTLPDLRPHEVLAAIRTIVLPIRRDASALADLVAQLAAALSQEKLIAYHHALFHTVAANLSWSLDVLRTTSNEPLIVGAAVDVLADALTRDTASALDAVGGIDGLIALIDKSMSHASVKRFFKAMSAKHDRPAAATHLVDALLKAGFAFLELDSPTHLDRLAPCMVSTLALACSSKVLRQLLPRLANLMVEHHWWKLVLRYPRDIQELVLIQVDDKLLENDWFQRGALDRPSWLAPCIPHLLKAKPADDPDFGRNFFGRFLHCYSERLRETRLAGASMDVLGRDIGRLEVLDEPARYYLESIVDVQKRATTALNVLEDFETIRSADESYEHTQLLHVFVHLFAKRPDLWEPSLQYPVPQEDPILQGLWRCIKNMPTFKLWNVEDWFHLSRQPRGARFPLLHLAFSVAGIPLTVAPSEDQRERFPQFRIALLARLSPVHAKLLVKIGTEAKGAEAFFKLGELQEETQIAKQISQALKVVNEIPVERRNDIQLAVLRAAWVGATRGPAGDLSTNRGIEDSITDVDADIETYLNEAYCSPKPELRFRYTKLALSLCILAQSPRRFADNLAAAMERFVEDAKVSKDLFDWATSTSTYSGNTLLFYCGPSGLFFSNATAARSGVSLESLTAWVTASSDAVRTLLDYLEVRPWTSKWTHDGMEDLFGKLFQGRCKLIARLVGSVFADPNTASSILLQPIAELFQAWDRLKVLEYPTELEFGWKDCVPRISSYFHIPASLAPTLLPLVVDLAKRREDLWREGRARLPPPTNPEDASPKPEYNHAELLPFSITIEGEIKHCYDIAAPPTLEEYCEIVLFPPPETRAVVFAAKLPSTDPRYFHQQMFESALELYIRWSRRDELEAKLLRLLDFYAEGPLDDSVWVLMSKPMQLVLWKLPEIALRAKVLLPTSTSSFVQQTPPPGVSTDQELPPTFNPMPTRRPDQPQLSTEDTETHESSNWLLFLQLRGNYHSPSVHHPPLSLNTRRQLAAFALSTVATRAKLSPKPVGADADLVTYATYAGRIDSGFADYKHVANPVVRQMIRLSLAALTDAEVVAIIDYLFEPEKNAEAQDRAFRILRAVRTQRPRLLTKWSRPWLEKPDMTYRHRYFVAPPVFRHVSPQDAVRGIVDLVKFVRERMDLENERQRAKKIQEAATRESTDVTEQQPVSGDEEPEEDIPLIKMASVKLVAQVIGYALSEGSVPLDEISLLFELRKVVPHQSIVQLIIKQLLKLAASDATLRPAASSPAFDGLCTFVETASRLSESRRWDEDNWTKLQADPKLPLPVIDIEHPIAAVLLDVPITSFPQNFAVKYATMIVQPMVLRNTFERTRLLRTVSEFQGYSDALEASYEPPFDIPNIYQKFGQFLSHPPFANANEPPTSILDLLQRRPTLVLRRQQYRDLVDLCRQRLGPDWASTPHGQTLSLLARPAITDETEAIQQALDGLFQALLADTASVNARTMIAAALQRIGDAHLDTASMKISAAPPPNEPSEPFSLFQALLRSEAVVNLVDGGKVAWSARVQPIIRHFLDTAKRNAKVAGPISGYGAFYERVIIKLELLLLPHPSHFHKSMNETYTLYVDHLLTIADRATASKVHRSYSTILDFLSQSTRLQSYEAMAVADELLERSISAINDMLRVTAVELAIALVQAHANSSDALSSKRVLAIRERLLGSDDGRLIALASFTIGSDNPSASNSKSPGGRGHSLRGRGGRRGRGRGSRSR